MILKLIKNNNVSFLEVSAVNMDLEKDAMVYNYLGQNKKSKISSYFEVVLLTNNNQEIYTVDTNEEIEEKENEDN